MDRKSANRPDISKILKGYTPEELSEAAVGEESILGCILHEICAVSNLENQIRLFRQLKEERPDIYEKLPLAEQSVFPPGKTPSSFKVVYTAKKG